jgi:hypothetical protein
MMKLPHWLRDEKQRAIVGFVAAGFAAIVGGLWTAYTYFGKSDVKMEVTYTLCVGPDQKYCPSQSIYLPGYVSMASPANRGRQAEDVVANWVKQECARYGKKSYFWGSGPMAECGCVVVQVKCSA